MGFSVSASTAIIFAGLFLAVGILYPAVSNGYELVTDAEVDREDARLDMRNSEINITDLDGTINVTNEGSTALDASEIDVVVNGEYQPRDDYTTAVEEDTTTDLWLPGETLSIDPTDVGAGTGDQIRVVTDHGLTATGEI
jgi:flagellar protein FlaF